MSKIIVVEDNLYTAEDLNFFIEIYFEEFFSEELDIIVCNDIYEANEALEKERNIDCIISDLNMNPDGLNEQLHEETLGTVLTGWVWVKYYILDNKSHSQIPIIFYSAFIDELKANTNYEEYKDNHQIELVTKEIGSEKRLCDKIKEIISK